MPDPDAGAPPVPEADDKDWTWVLERRCPECGFDPAGRRPERTADEVRATVPRWSAVLARPGATRRPSPQVWSPTEYGAHVRDVCVLFRERLTAMLATDGARFTNWDQDETARERRYWEADPEVVAREYAAAAEQLAAEFDGVLGPAWDHRGHRSNGSEFTVRTFAAYLLHDLEHHLVDVDG